MNVGYIPNIVHHYPLFNIPFYFEVGDTINTYTPMNWFIRKRLVYRIEFKVILLAIKKDCIVHSLKMFCCSCPSSIMPNNLILEVLSPKHLIQYQLQVVAGGGVAVKIERTGIPKHPA